MANASEARSSRPDPETICHVYSEPPALRRDGAYCWAVWSACRLSPELLAQIARAAVWQVGHHAEAAECFIDVRVRDDVERFRSGQEFKEEATSQAQRRFSRLMIRVRSPDLDVDVTILRDTAADFSWREVPSVVLEVGTASKDPKHAKAVKDIRQRVIGALDRGTFSFFHKEPKCGEPHDRLKPELRSRVAKRRTWVATLYLFCALLTVVVVAVLAGVLDLLPFAGKGFAAYGAVIATAVQVLAVLVRWVTDAGPGNEEWVARWRRRVDAIFFPAVEVAERTPGRRVLRLLVRLFSLAVAPLLGALAKEVIPKI